MHPRDLLNLARTSKDFRSLLMSRTSAIFWRAARQQIPGLPECPPFLSEPQYANLLFFSHCHVSCVSLFSPRVRAHTDRTRDGWTGLSEGERKVDLVGPLRAVLPPL